MCDSSELRIEDICVRDKVSSKKVKDIASFLKIPTNQYGNYVFPIDFELPYLPDGRKYKSNIKNPLFKYIYVMDLIQSSLNCCYGYCGITDIDVRTCVRELCSAGYIVIKDGCKQDSLNYKDYMLSLSCNDWFDRKWKKKLELISTMSASVSYGVALATLNN